MLPGIHAYGNSAVVLVDCCPENRRIRGVGGVKGEGSDECLAAFVAGEPGAVECDINWDTVEVDGYVDEYRAVRGECAVDCRRKLAKDKGQGLPAGEPVFFLGGVAEAKEAAVNLYGAQHYAFEGEVLKQEADCRVVYLGYRNVLGDSFNVMSIRPLYSPASCSSIGNEGSSKVAVAV